MSREERKELLSGIINKYLGVEFYDLPSGIRDEIVKHSLRR